MSCEELLCEQVRLPVVAVFPISCPGVRGKPTQHASDTVTSGCRRPLTITQRFQVDGGGEEGEDDNVVGFAKERFVGVGGLEEWISEFNKLYRLRLVRRYSQSCRQPRQKEEKGESVFDSFSSSRELGYEAFLRNP